ncbi:MAG TPA: pitrilysin family protein [Jatrophihabitans sp.]|nr:pitrilysin family protein [Jatrophihabitans sp.]
MTNFVPSLTEPRAARKLRSAEAVLDNGLRVIAVRKPGIPLVELRLRVPFLSAKAEHPARAMLLAEALLTGAAGYDRAGLAAAIQALGGDLHAGVDADRLVIGGNVLATNLRKLLDVLAAVVTEPAYAAGEVGTERDRLVERLTIMRARPSVVAAEALSHRMWGDHPYAVDLARPADVSGVSPAQLRSLHRSLVRPGGAALVLVGDLAPGRMIDAAAKALGGWTGAAARTKVPELPAPPGGPLQLVHRPGSVQSSFRLGGPALPRTDADYPALQLANLIFGGYFTSRWTENLREDKGYTYGPHSRVDHHVLGSVLTLSVEVAGKDTAPAHLETLYELGRLATLPVSEQEVASVKQYAIGTLALSTATQAGLASTLSALSAFGLGLDWITGHPDRLLATTVEQVSAAAARFFAPAAFTSVVVGDADAVAGPLAALVPVERQPAEQ